MMKARRAGERSAGRGDRLGHDLSDRGRAQRHEGRDARVCRARRNAEGSVRVASATKALLTLRRPSRALPAVSDQSRQPPSMTARDTRAPPLGACLPASRRRLRRRSCFRLRRLLPEALPRSRARGRRLRCGRAATGRFARSRAGKRGRIRVRTAGK